MSGRRSIFEEVGGEKPKAPKPSGGVIDATRRGSRSAIRLWLMVLFSLVVIMIAVGGLTRLTDSGLSITEWAPITGAVPPLSETDWQGEFEAYRLTPEYQLQNQGMSLAEFKLIYWWEWSHRQLGRVIGLVWAIGFLGFLSTRRIPTGWTGRLLLIGVLGGLQGAIGWWMVSSGLEGTMLDVASYRLAVHLGLAFAILGLIAWFVMLLDRSEAALLQARRAREPRLFSMSTGLMHFAMLQIVLGALVAGIDAGRNFTDWPLMAGGIFPPDPFRLEPVWRNFFEDDGLVQFMHRIAGYLLFVFGLVVWRKSQSSGNIKTRFAFNAVLATMALQLTLGVLTVIYSAQWQTAIVHQLGAVLLWVLIIRGRFLTQYPQAQSVRGRDDRV